MERKPLHRDAILLDRVAERAEYNTRQIDSLRLWLTGVVLAFLVLVAAVVGLLAGRP